MAPEPGPVDLGADFAAYQQKVLDRLVSVTKTASHLASQDLGFHRSSSDQVSKSLERQGRHLLELTSRLLKAAAADGNQAALCLRSLDDIDDKWRSIIDVVDDQFEKADAALDEYTGVIKRLSPAAVQHDNSSPRSSPAVHHHHHNNNSNTTTTKYSKPGATHLPKVLDKPQTRFDRKVNNLDTRPFKPLLTYKPHAIKSLEESIGDGSDNRYGHPYAHEIEQYAYPARVYQCAPPIPSAPPEKTPVTMVDSEEAMLQMVVELKRAKEIAVDLEHHNYRSYVGIVCLMQISTRDKDWIIDTLKPWREKLHILNEVFADPKIVKVFHGSNMDIIWLQRDLGLYVVGLLDTFYASEALGLPFKSLKYLLHRFANFEAQKQYQMADWRLRPLPAELVDYARSDTHYLLNVYDQLRNLLIENSTPDKNLIDYVLSNSKKEALQVYERFVYEPESGRGSFGWFQLFTDLPNNFNSEQFAVFRALHEWRDRKARELDESPVYVLNNKSLWTLAQFKPTNQTELYFHCRPVPSFVLDHFSEFQHVVFKAMREAKNDPPVKEMIRQNEEKYGLVHNRWRKSREQPPRAPSHVQGVGAFLNQLRQKADTSAASATTCSASTNAQTQPGPATVGAEDSSSPLALDRAHQSSLWGPIPSFISPDAVEFALAFMAVTSVFPLQTLTGGQQQQQQQHPASVAPASEAEATEPTQTAAPVPAESNQQPNRQPKNDVFTLREAGRKRKASDATSTLTSGLIKDQSPTAEKRVKKDDKRSKKTAKQTPATVPFNYAAQPSLLTTPTNVHSSAGLPMNPFAKSAETSSDKTKGVGLPMNPYAKALNTSTGARQNKMGKELAGKSMTFKS